MFFLFYSLNVYKFVVSKSDTLQKNKKNMEKTIILVKYGEITEIARIFNISTRTVRRALAGNTSVRDYHKIRKYALDKGAIEVQEVIKNDY